MAKENTVLTIDVGGDNLKMAEFAFPAGGAIELRAFAFRKLEMEEENPGIAFAHAYREMIAENGFTAKRVRLSLSGQSSFSRLSKLPPLMGGKGASRIVEFEARQTVPYPMNEVVWDYQLIRHTWEEHRVETQEDGSTLEIDDTHEEYEALFVAVKNDQITCYTDVIQDSGKDIVSVEIAPVALFNAAKGGGQCRDDECVLLLNIGGQGSNLMIADHNRAFIRSIPIAGDSITHQVAKEFGIGFAEAEELKHRHGFVALGGAYEEPESEVAATISKIARNVMTRLHGEVSRSINVWRAQHGGNAPTRVLLSGGGSTMLYITDFFHEKLRVPVAYLNTFGAIQIAPAVDKEALQAVAPMFQELIGMSLRDVTQCPIDISLIPRSIRKQKELNRKKPYFYISAFSLIVCLLIFSVGVHKRLNFDKSRVERVRVRVDETTRKMDEVNRLMSSFNVAKGRYDEAMAFLKSRSVWTDMLTELQSLIPDKMWLTTVEGYDENAAAAASGGEAAPGGPFGPFGGPPEANADVSDTAIPDLTEVQQLRLVGYTMVIDGNDLLETKFRNKLKTSKFFSSEEDGSVQLKYVPDKPGLFNLTSFEMLVKLKEPIKK